MTRILPENTGYLYDGTFDGFLCLIFKAFEYRSEPAFILPENRNTQLVLGDFIKVVTDPEKAKRVWHGLGNCTNQRNTRLVHVAFLSELPEVEMLLWRYLKKVFRDKSGRFYLNMLDDDVFELVQTARKVKKEVHRFHGFIRFQKTADGMYFAPFDPDHNILRLLAPHFKSRFPQQKWVIYDTRRNYGLYYDCSMVREIILEDHKINFHSGNLAKEVKDLDEDYYCSLWKHYYDAVNILERKNHRQMKNFMPKRYWKYLPEKNKPGGTTG